MSHLTLDQIDEINTIQACLSAIADLMQPATDLHCVSRDNSALLLSYFTDRLKDVLTVTIPAIETAQLKAASCTH
ncbi:hypothetical protein [Methylobacter sp. S3L5C]|uniref:hypothetical protein n=1 Tax=Methylobacter sp. S3L5C TaxID=2839024 RepID=UPI001FAD505F|nr:hypothetical protein [Methylobacter sp. S3L5C]UOA08939.1 hypothetical protein KKZ03_01050 [Methylobacter sp. S3L5C]